MKKSISFIIISLMAFYASAQSLYIGSLYVTTPEEEALYGDGKDLWANRMPVIGDMFIFEQPDIVGLQSATSSQLSALSKRMKSYRLAGDILYNNTIELDTCGVIEGLPEGKTGTWAKFSKDSTAFCVFNIFFDANTGTDNAGVSALVKAISEVNTESLPCFVVGNIGSSDSKTAYSRLASRYNDCFKKAPFVSAEFGTMNGFDLEANHGTARYDFVFAPRLATIKAYGQLQYGYYTKESDGSYKRRLPSSHFPVMAKVILP